MPFKPAKKTPPTSRRIPGRKPQWNPTMGNTAPTVSYSGVPGVGGLLGGAAGGATAAGAKGGVMPPVSQGGGGNMMSVGNSANGSINLGNILGPRANPAYDPANPGTSLPYKSPGFLRRVFGDTGSNLNAQYSADRNAAASAAAEKEADWNRQADLQRELKNQDLQMRAAESNLNNSGHLQGIQMQMDARAAMDQAARSQKMYEDTGTSDPILQSAILAERAAQNTQMGSAKPLGGSAMAVYNRWGNEPDIFAREGGTPAQTTLVGDKIQTIPAVPGSFQKINPTIGGGAADSRGMQQGATGGPSATGGGSGFSIRGGSPTGDTTVQTNMISPAQAGVASPEALAQLKAALTSPTTSAPPIAPRSTTPPIVELIKRWLKSSGMSGPPTGAFPGAAPQTPTGMY